MNKNALTAGLALAVLGIGLLFVYAQRFEIERTGGDPVQILVAKKAIVRGNTIVDSMLTVRSVPLAYVEDRAVRASEREKVLGLRSTNSLEPNEALAWSDFADHSDESRDLSSMVMPDYRAVYIRAMREDQGAMLVRPGDYVDVVATVADGGETRTARKSVVLLQRVMVLANGMRTTAEPPLADPDDKHPKNLLEDHGLTLNLSLQQAQTVAVAASRGFLTVALRNPGDARTFAFLPTVTTAALLDPIARAAIQSGTYDPEPGSHGSTEGPP
jgi:pilus assembly protein CpaB